MSTIETSLHPIFLLLGAGISIAFFGYILRQQTNNHSFITRWSLILLRSILCLLVWFLIAQPRAMKTSEETLPIIANMGIDVSKSMTLADSFGTHTSAWMNFNEPMPLSEAVTLSEAARIRVNLLSRDYKGDEKSYKAEVESIIKILSQVRIRLDSIDGDSSLSRILKAPMRTLEEAKKILNQSKWTVFPTDLDRSSNLISMTSRGLRQIISLQQSAIPTVQQTPRIEFINSWINGSQDVFDDLSKRYKFQISTFSDEVNREKLNTKFKVKPSESLKTHLYQSLNAVGKRVQSGATQFSMLVTDGFDSGETDNNFSDDILSQPLIVFPIGDPITTPDSRILSVVSPSRIRDQDNFIATVLVSSINSAPETLTLKLLENDNVLAEKEVLLKGNGTSQQVDLEWQASGAGLHQLQVKLSPVEGDTVPQNNINLLECIVLKDHYKILVSDTFPRWETRYLQNLFNRDPSIKMHSIVFQPNHVFPGSDSKQPPTLPFDLESWKLFDLVILGDLTPEYLTPIQQKLLLDYVDQGGNLIIMAGPNGMPSLFVDGPLEPLIPMSKVAESTVYGSFVVHPPTNNTISRMVQLDSEQSQQIWQSIFQTVPQNTLSPWLKTKESARTLLVASDKKNGATYDFCATQRYGSGQVAYFAAPCLYHLRFRYGDEYHAKIWGQLIRGLCVDSFGFNDSFIATRMDKQSWKLGEKIQGQLRIRNEDGSPFEETNFTAILSKNGTVIAEMQPTPVANRPGDFFIRFNDIDPGQYEINYAGAAIESIIEMNRNVYPDQAAVSIQVYDLEKSNETQFPIADSKFWSRVNELPLAALISPGTLPLMIEALDFKAEVLNKTSILPLWDNCWTLLLILIVAASEWVLRRLTGLS